MQFGTVSVADALGAVLAHSVSIGRKSIPKGTKVTEDIQEKLTAAAVASVTIARLGQDDTDENTAAQRIGQALAGAHFTVTKAFSGRVNLMAATSGVCCVSAKTVQRLNRIDEGITFATLQNYARVGEGALIGTVKIIPYGVSTAAINTAVQLLQDRAISLYPFGNKTVDLVLTQTPGFKPSLLAKGEDAVVNRMRSLGLTVQHVQTVAHDEDAIAKALRKASGNLVLILGASATSDRADVAPSAVVQSGGQIERFGMPVDPGNLLFYGNLGEKHVVGLPGCVRAPALNGADWVLERIAAGLPLTADDIAEMGVGGLLKEIPQRAQPRLSRKPAKADKIEIILLAAGRSSRMKGAHKLFREIDGQPLLRRTAQALLSSQAAAVKVVVPEHSDRHAEALNGLDVKLVTAKDAELGLSASLRAGISVVSSDSAAAIIALADMPDVTAEHINALIAAYNPADERFICTPVAPNGKRGNPVLFDRSYFEDLSNLSGDHGAKQIIDAASDYVAAVPLNTGVLVDLDTPEAWEDWEKVRS